MSDEKLARFLFLPDLKLHKVVRVTPATTTYLLVKTTPYEVCPRCATKSATVYDHRNTRAKDASIRGKHMVYIIRKRRFWCAKCRKPFMEPIQGISKYCQTTQRYKAQLLWRSKKFSNLKEVKKAARCSDGYLYKAVEEMLELNRKKRLYPWPKIIGLDEHKFKRTKKRELFWATIVVDHVNKRVFEVVEGKDGDSLKIALGAIPGREKVLFVTIDMAEHFRLFCKGFFPNAQLVVDRFHVERLFTKALNRKRIDITGDERKNPIRTLLLRNGKDLEAHERKALREWLNHNLDARELYDLKEAMHRFYKVKGYRCAHKIFKNILDRMGRSKQPAAQKLRETLVSWRHEILAYHLTKLTNARAEGFNRIAKLLQRKAFGYRTFKMYRLKLLDATL